MSSKKLSKVLNEISDSIKENFSNGIWVECEIASVSRHAKSGHWYLELVELDDNGNEICKVKASIWKFKSDAIINKFKTFTGSDLSSGMKILVLAVPNFHIQYHLSFNIEDIKPEFTLGGIEAKINSIIKELKEKGEYDKNKKLKTPSDFTRCAVIAPFGAAGLGDFKKEADILEKYNICKFDYFEAVFQGKEVSEAISEKIKNIVFSDYKYDCIIIIRGGGSKTDLHFMNDLKIARFACRSPIPVFVGIGHERDVGVLDYIANKSFDTPSKVIEYIYSIVVQNANEIKTNLELIKEKSLQKIDNFKHSVNLISERTSSIIKQTTGKHSNDVEKMGLLIREGANKQIFKIKNDLHSGLSSIEHYSKSMQDKYKTNIFNLSNEIERLALKNIEDNKKSILSNYGLVNAYRPSYILDLGFAMLRFNEKILSNMDELKKGDSLVIESKNNIIEVKVINNKDKGE